VDNSVDELVDEPSRRGITSVAVVDILWKKKFFGKCLANPLCRVDQGNTNLSVTRQRGHHVGGNFDTQGALGNWSVKRVLRDWYR
jgi:hypothetical protein